MIINVNTPWIGDGLTADTAWRPQINEDFPQLRYMDATGQQNSFSDPSMFAIQLEVTQTVADGIALNSTYYINYTDTNKDEVKPDIEFLDLVTFLLSSRFTQAWIDTAIGTSVAGRTRLQITEDLQAAFKTLPRMTDLLKYDSPTLGSTVLHTDMTVYTDGALNTNAVVSFAEERYRIDVDGNGIINANPVPNLGAVKVTREPGWQGALGYRCVLLDWAADATPNAIGMAVYNLPDGNDYSYTTGAMLWDATAEEWYCTCPAGFEPGDNDIYMGFLYGSINVYSFTMPAAINEKIFNGGGDYNSAAQASFDLDGDGNPDRIVAMPRSTQAIIGGHAVISVDDDSINIDLDNDGDADIVFPR